MILIERETLNLALEALKEKFTLPDDVVIHKENGAYGNFDALVQIMNVDFLCKIKGNIYSDQYQHDCKSFAKVYGY